MHNKIQEKLRLLEDRGFPLTIVCTPHAWSVLEPREVVIFTSPSASHINFFLAEYVISTLA